MTTQEILDALDDPDANDCTEAVAEVEQRPEEFIPLFIAAVECVVRDPVSEEYFYLPTIGLFLLAQLQAASAFEPLLAALGLDIDSQEAAFGFSVLEHGSRLLLGVTRKNPGLLKESVLHKSHSADARSAALHALVLRVAWGLQPLDEVVQFFHQLFDGNAFADDPEMWTNLVDACLDLDGSLFLPKIRKLYKRKLVDEELIGFLEDVEEEALTDREERFASIREYSRLITNAAEEWEQVLSSDEEDFANEEGAEDSATPVQAAPKIGRNDLCPCGSGKKYKKCCLQPGG